MQNVMVYCEVQSKFLKAFINYLHICFKGPNIIAPFRKRTQFEHNLYWFLGLIVLIVQKSSTFPKK